ncbi:hypothetical protein A4X09_0g1446 [Tilletia walkeri]|uniref:RING-type domain-containing protein n=1 Tax=Tilletia walkeri TaxID=117179 RepID=A0A8X7NEC2_9BASI|nr:hypothetical protein A4X09_0g1446 [Tilletia walkeri]
MALCVNAPAASSSIAGPSGSRAGKRALRSTAARRNNPPPPPPAARSPIKLHEVIEISSDEDEDRRPRPPPRSRRRSHSSDDDDDDFEITSSNIDLSKSKEKEKEKQPESPAEDAEEKQLQRTLRHVLNIFPDLNRAYGKELLKELAAQHSLPVHRCTRVTIEKLLDLEATRADGYPRAPPGTLPGGSNVGDASAMSSDMEEDDSFYSTGADTSADGSRKRKGKEREVANDEDGPQQKRARMSIDYADFVGGGAPLSDGPSGIECPVCCEEDIAWSNLIQCPEGHLFCIDCCRRQAEGLLGVRKCDLKCMDFDGCDFSFSTREVKRFLSEKSFELYEKIKQEQEISQAGIESLESCPFCPYSVDMGDVPDELLFKCLNDGCRKISCRFCKEPDHRPQTCAELAHSKISDPLHKGEEALSAALMRFCPKCKAAIVKDVAVQGCNKMRCNCGTLMCYVCRKDITKEGYSHFDQNPHDYRLPKDKAKCKLWEDTASRHRKELEAVRKQLGKDAPPESPADKDKDKAAAAGQRDAAGNAVAGPAPRFYPALGHLRALWGGRDPAPAPAPAPAAAPVGPPLAPRIAVQGGFGRMPGMALPAPQLLNRAPPRAPPRAPAAPVRHPAIPGPDPIGAARQRRASAVIAAERALAAARLERAGINQALHRADKKERKQERERRAEQERLIAAALAALPPAARAPPALDARAEARRRSDARMRLNRLAEGPAPAPAPAAEPAQASGSHRRKDKAPAARPAQPVASSSRLRASSSASSTVSAGAASNAATAGSSSSSAESRARRAEARAKRRK